MEKASQKINPIKGRPMLYWYGKKPLEAIEYFPAQEKEVYGNKNAKEFNKIFWGDNLQVLSHLLKDYRGEIDLIYIDPPFDSKADYVKKVKIRGKKVEGEQQSLLEEKQYTDIWENDEYLQFMYERLQIMRELLSEKGSIYLHCDYRKVAHLRLLMDEIFGQENFRNEVIWRYRRWPSYGKDFQKMHDNILRYSKTDTYSWNQLQEPKAASTQQAFGNTKLSTEITDKGTIKKIKTDEISEGTSKSDVWEISMLQGSASKERTSYPTQKPEELISVIVEASSNPGDLIMDCFLGSGTTLAVAQKLGRRWIGCDINIGAVQTTVKRLNQILEEQKKENSKLLKEDFKGLNAFKVFNVNEYDIFKNELEAKEIVMEMYGVEPIKRTYFDGILDKNLVKVMPLNRVLNKLDIKAVLQKIDSQIEDFTPKKESKSGEATYEEKVIIIASGAESDVVDYLKKENKTGVGIEVRDIQSDKKNLIFKQPPEAEIAVKANGKEATIEIKDFYSPLLIQKLEQENKNRLREKDKTFVGDFKQIIDSVAIDIDYNGKLFNAEIMDLPAKGEVIKGKYKYTYEKADRQLVAIKIIDVLGEEYFATYVFETK